MKPRNPQQRGVTHFKQVDPLFPNRASICGAVSYAFRKKPYNVINEKAVTCKKCLKKLAKRRWRP